MYNAENEIHVKIRDLENKISTLKNMSKLLDRFPDLFFVKNSDGSEEISSKHANKIVDDCYISETCTMPGVSCGIEILLFKFVDEFRVCSSPVKFLIGHRDENGKFTPYKLWKESLIRNDIVNQKIFNKIEEYFNKQ